MRVFDGPSSRAPEVHFLSNGRYHLAISNAGGGYTRWGDLAVTRWREDGTRDCWGTFIYLRDTATGEFWSVAYQPTLRPTEQYEVTFAGSRVEYRRREGNLAVCTEICVSAEDDVEMWRVTLTNYSDRERSIELTSYAEVVLAVPAADAAHPVFSNLFVQTEFIRANSAILCTRRPRSEGEMRPWLLHWIAGEEGARDAISCETDRARFVGRGRTPISPAAMHDSSPLSDTVGSVLDPIVSLRRTFRLDPGQTVRVDFLLGVTETRETALTLLEKYQDPLVIDRSFDLARTDMTLAELGVTDGEAQIYMRLGSALIYADSAKRAPLSALLANRGGQPGLWKHGISGDLPIVLLHLNGQANIQLVKQLIQAHSYWRTKGLPVDLIILIERVTDSSRPLYEQIVSSIAPGRKS
jgi:cyclic beta-1,2-glucan synthetase